jgi:tetratricopeptide (TPR) repeat protein
MADSVIPIPDLDYLLDPLPAADDLDGLWQRIVDIGNWAKRHRDRGDDLLEVHGEASAKMAFEKALDLERRSIEIAKRYDDFNLMFDADGRPLPSGRNSNYPLQGGEQRLAMVYCDRLGRIGGLLRRMGRLEEAKRYYSIGAEIEKEGGNFGVTNSYCTVNNMLLDIELGEKSVTPGLKAAKSDISTEIKRIILFLRRQLDGLRANDAWAKADLAVTLTLLGDDNDTRKEAADYFSDYVKAARPRDIGATLRILRLVRSQLEDPAETWTAWAIDLLENEARAVGKLRSA